MRAKALLLAAGEGTRLWPLTAVRAKAAVPYCGVPLIRRLVTSLHRAGVTEIAVNLHHRADTVRAALQGIRATYSYEDAVLGTSGALNPLRGFLEGSPFWSVNAKIVCSFVPPDDTYREEQEPVVTATLVRGAPGDPYTRVDIGGDPPEVLGFRPAQEHDGSGFVFTGIQLVSPRIWEFLPKTGFSHFTTDVYPAIWARGGSVAAQVATGEWREFSTLQRYLEHHLATGGVGRRYWGDHVTIGASASVRDCIVWDHVTIEEGARLCQCVLTDGVVVRSGRKLERMAIAPLDSVGEDSRGEVLDDNLLVEIPSRVSLSGGGADDRGHS